ncbi:YidB family protein [Pseudorhodoplanes sp.]|uniref:YidB family protein n=1 Tax=Pseudorhodoplanes sp. TaxID=1934341 RepID=UPI002C54E12D|nr:YidB family protein [Pseudorhodoplanes sp.]HWV52725.1 YidB family protein [Pseudorhodoplanes sp.]
MGILDILLGGAGARGGAQGGSGGGNMTKIGMALIAYMLWRWYQNSRAGGGAEPAPVPAPGGGGRARMPQQEPPAQLPHGDPLDIPAPRSGSPSDSDFGPLIESTQRMPPASRGGGRDMDDGGGMGGGMGGGLGDILNDILNGGRGMPGGQRGGPSGDPRGGGGLNDVLGEILGGGRSGNPRGGPAGGGRGGGLEDILGDILGGGRGGGIPGSRVAGLQGDPFSGLLQGAGVGGLGGLLAGGANGGMLGDLMRQFDQAGAGDAARSWVSQGDNVPVTPQQVESTFGSDVIDQLADQFGLSKPELLQGLSEALPDVVNQLTPDGRLPTEDEISRWR